MEVYHGSPDFRRGVRPPDLDRRRHTFDPRTYRYNYQSERRYHWRPYARPCGWFYHRWIFGDVLPPAFWTQDYWITEFLNFGLPIPHTGYVWVRYSDDALLIDVEAGSILQVIYGVFY